jgi:hypothetical protein
MTANRSRPGRMVTCAGRLQGELAMRKSSAVTLAASAGIAALVVVAQPIYAQSSAARCEAGRNASAAKCGPAATGNPLFPPQRQPKSSLSGVYDGNSILNDTGPGFSTQGPAATGAPAARPSAAPPVKIY